MTIIVKSVYTKKQLEIKKMTSYKEAEDYVFAKYNAVYDIEQEAETATFYVYNRAKEENKTMEKELTIQEMAQEVLKNEKAKKMADEMIRDENEYTYDYIVKMCYFCFIQK